MRWVGTTIKTPEGCGFRDGEQTGPVGISWKQSSGSWQLRHQPVMRLVT